MNVPLIWLASWAGSKVCVTIGPDGAPAFVDKVDPMSAVARKRLLDRIANTFRSVDLAPIESRLLEMAACGPPAKATGPAASRSIVDPDPEPAADPVDGAQLLQDVADLLSRHVVLPAHGANTVALWALTSHVYDAFTYTPRLLIASPVMRSGKSLLLRLVAALVARPLTTEGISAAALFRVIEAARPTILADEADTFLVPRRGASESSEALRGVVNSGHQKGGRIVRCEGENHEPVAYSTFAPMVLAMIGRPPATILDRSIVVPMRRRAQDEHVERIRPGRTLREQHEGMVRRCRRWADDHRDVLAEVEPAIPAGLNDRQADCWWSLLAVADAVGGPWPVLAREAAVALSKAPADDEVAAIHLLADLRDVFGAVDRLATAEVLRGLLAIDSAPWATWHHGGPLTAHGLARLLRPFDVKPRNFRMASRGVLKGYLRDDFEDCWRRYLGTPPAQAATPLQPLHGKGLAQSASATARDAVAGRFEHKSLKTMTCSGVADQEPGIEAVEQLRGLVDALATALSDPASGSSDTADDVRTFYQRHVRECGVPAAIADAGIRLAAAREGRAIPLPRGDR